MLTSLIYSFKEGKFKTLKSAGIAIGSAIFSGLITIALNQYKIKHSKVPDLTTIKNVIKHISINRIIRGTFRISLRIGKQTYKLVLS